ncbi:MAG: hypothetical protein CMA77_04040, partial [Euryarchaeota archaeon]|nr:hypothetical protein [Euryarchaeota archaeon]
MDSGLSDDVLSDEPVMPEIPIKPNKGIPITIGILLIIGALIVGSFAFGNLTTGTITEEEATAITDSLNLQGANLTNGEVVDYFGDLQKAGYYTTLGIIESLATLALLAGGALLIMGRKLGVWVGASGAGLMLLDAM